jgi:hypothetical protein
MNTVGSTAVLSALWATIITDKEEESYNGIEWIQFGGGIVGLIVMIVMLWLSINLMDGITIHSI